MPKEVQIGRIHDTNLHAVCQQSLIALHITLSLRVYPSTCSQGLSSATFKKHTHTHTHTHTHSFIEQNVNRPQYNNSNIASQKVNKCQNKELYK